IARDAVHGGELGQPSRRSGGVAVDRRARGLEVDARGDRAASEAISPQAEYTVRGRAAELVLAGDVLPARLEVGDRRKQIGRYPELTCRIGEGTLEIAERIVRAGRGLASIVADRARRDE